MSYSIPKLVPLRKNDPSRVLLWIFTFVVYLTILALTTVLILENALNRWNINDSSSLTIQLTPAQDIVNEGQVGKAKRILEEIEGIKDIYILSKSENLALIEPWIGTESIPSNLPLPRLIDIRLENGSELSAETLLLKLQDSISNVRVVDSKQWFNNVIDISQSAKYLAVTIIILIGLTAAVTVYFTTRMGMSIHKNIIELLHLIGAEDNYLAAQFQKQAILLGFRGSILGCIFSAVTLYGICHVMNRSNSWFIPGNLLPYWEWPILAAVPIVSIIIAGTTARFTVLKELKKII